MSRMKLPLLAVAVAVMAVGYAAAGHAAATLSVPKCPSHAPPFSSLNVASSHFVRREARVVRLCRYYGVNWGDSQGLWRHRLIQKHRAISSLTRAFNALKAPPRGIFCMQDDGSEILLVFGYAGAKPERVVVKLSGCRFASNGRSTRSTTAGLHTRLLALSKG